MPLDTDALIRRRLVDFNPKIGDVFEHERFGKLTVISATHARFDAWPGYFKPEPFDWFRDNFRKMENL